MKKVKSKHPLYVIWKGMYKRCNNPNDKAYHLYGGRGIEVCERWRDFWAFVEDIGERPKGYSIDRIDNEGPYSPENCRWASPKEQARNKRTNKLVTWNGVTKCLVEWAEDLGINYSLLSGRLARGMSIEEASTCKKYYHMPGERSKKAEEKKRLLQERRDAKKKVREQKLMKKATEKRMRKLKHCWCPTCREEYAKLLKTV